MTSIFFTILPLIVAIFFTFEYCKNRVKLNYFKYIFFALYPYICSNIAEPDKYSFLLHILSILIIIICFYEVLNHKLILSSILKAYIVFVLYIIISGLIIYPDNNFFIGIRNIIVFSLTAFFLYYGENTNIDVYKKISRVNVIFLSLTGIFQFIFDSKWSLQYLYTNLRITGITMNANTYAMLILIHLCFACMNERFNHNLKYFVIAGCSIILSGSDSGTLCYLLMLFDFKVLKNLFSRLYKLFVCGAFAFMFGMVVVRWRAPHFFNTLFESQLDRMSLWAVYLNAFFEKPIFGHGWYTLHWRLEPFLYNLPNNYYTNYIIDTAYTKGGAIAPHNDLIRLLAETGVIGLFLCLILIYYAFKISYKENNLWIVKLLICGVLFYLTQNTVQGYDFWIVFFTPLLLMESRRGNEIATYDCKTT